MSERSLAVLDGGGQPAPPPPPPPEWMDGRESVLRGLDALREQAETGNVQSLLWVATLTDGTYASRCVWKRGTRPYQLVGAIEMAKAELVSEVISGAALRPETEEE